MSIELRALWYDAKGDWTRAHALVQDETTPIAARVHAYLHRKEGDEWNARYWYRAGGSKPFTGSLEQEFSHLVSELTGVVRHHLRAVSQ